MEQAIDCKQYVGALPEGLWQEVEPLVKDAAIYARWEFMPEDVLEKVTSGDQQLWTVRDAGVLKFIWVTEILQQSGRKAVLVFAAAGVMEYGWKFWPWMSAWMLGNNITEAEVYCRPSMARLLRRHGLKTRYEMLTIMPFGGVEI